MHRGSTDRTSTTVRGHACHIDPDPATAGIFEWDGSSRQGRRGARRAHLARSIRTVQAPSGPPTDREFRIDRS
ncbi:hypothetical protein OJF2_70800 [Aquisphaera giovannonii]|uniref:Uncharacterized protein n=1 Tax=Aquisphaera giovannonii TaxID=406548 RepID=A0A5B9WD84_9BACT|nr:hypothetical protein [Aquisphaera giovannonii]QEH38477.1 hypothetical protein OJF2_70800 [Aquisphaera giovannonii]